MFTQGCVKPSEEIHRRIFLLHHGGSHVLVILDLDWPISGGETLVDQFNLPVRAVQGVQQPPQLILQLDDLAFVGESCEIGDGGGSHIASWRDGCHMSSSHNIFGASFERMGFQLGQKEWVNSLVGRWTSSESRRAISALRSPDAFLKR